MSESTAEFKEKDKTRIWDAFCQTDPSRTKGFSRGGGFKGTAINPTYIKERLTSFFGPIGLGWGYKVIDEEIIKGHKEGENQVQIHKVLIEFWYLFGERESKPIQAFGQTTMVGKNKNGWFTDEEAPKKSLTDALTKATSDLGMSADIHSGLYDDCKYVAEVKAKFSNKEPEKKDTPPEQPPQQPQPDPEKVPEKNQEGEQKVSKGQAGLIFHKFEDAGFNKLQMKEYWRIHYGVESNYSLPATAVKEIVDLFDAGNLLTLEKQKELQDDIPF